MTGPGKRARWPAERDEALKQLLADGLSAGAAALRLGVTRNAVISRARKLKCALSGAPPARRGDAEMEKLRGRIRAALAEGLTTSEIAARLGVDESTLRQQSGRLGLSPKPGRAGCSRPVVAARPAKAKTLRDNTNTVSIPLMPAAIPKTTEDAGAPAPLRVALTELRRAHCRWPLWPHHAGPGHEDYGFFCGAATGEGQSYCPHHRDIARAAGQPRGAA